MEYLFSRNRASVEQNVRAIAVGEINSALDKFGESPRKIAADVHRARKTCKKLRGLLRLIEPAFADYKAQDVAVRDAAEVLAFLRDSRVLIDTYDSIVDAYGDQIDRASFAVMRRRFTLRHKRALEHGNVEERFVLFRKRLGAIRKAASHWTLDQDGFAAIAPGLAKTYKRARKKMKQARKDPEARQFHKWRQHAKYHWYHARLLSPVWPDVMKAHGRMAHDLGDVLGDHHDLDVLRDQITAAPEEFGGQADVEVMLGLIRRRQAVLEARAFPLGERLFAESPARLVERWRAYWDIWRQHKPAHEKALVA